MSMDDHRNNDISAELAAAVTAARANAEPVYITGGNSKRDWMGRDCHACPLHVAAHAGIVDYQPTELVVTARAGTRISSLQRVLGEHGQTLASEPPLLGGAATLGGSVACNLSGPARPWAGSIRDAVLGVKIINGKGELLNFGGTVMKNVAGYDVSRLQAGALGTLGIMCDISLKVMPLPEDSLTLAYQHTAAQAIAFMNQRAAEPAPLSGACWVDGVTYLRLSGAASAVRSTAASWGGDQCTEHRQFWASIREQSHAFFAGELPLWRLSLTPTAALAHGQSLIDWGGAQRWVRSESQLSEIANSVATHGGHVSLFRGGDRNADVRGALDTAQQQLQQRLKRAFDPDGILNPGRLYSWM